MTALFFVELSIALIGMCLIVFFLVPVEIIFDDFKQKLTGGQVFAGGARRLKSRLFVLAFEWDRNEKPCVYDLFSSHA